MRAPRSASPARLFSARAIIGLLRRSNAAPLRLVIPNSPETRSSGPDGPRIDKKNAKVVHIRPGRSRHHEIAERRKDGVTVVVGEPPLEIDAGARSTRGRIGPDDRSGVVL